ncbi:HipA domain-containing protein, partial [Salinibacterium sp.]|uniref:type II toxin-antitoxin system HipA family toxin n=1 Tax=Salinibacterium sp. TaxID=1915057 RepID=UPI00286B5606
AGRQYSQTNQVIFGAFSDAAPDQWGERIIDANHALHQRADLQLPRRLGAFDYLLGVSDASRMGALRFRDADGWCSAERQVPNVHDLARIVAAARRYEADEASDDDVEYLGDIATSPGGARPKANVVLASGELALAKLPHSEDGDVDTEAWEALALSMASNAGIHISPFALHTVSHEKSVLVVNRFDRRGRDERLGYVSAATALGIGANDDDRITYEEFADVIAELSAQPSADLHEMFARVALTVLINNVDDHWRNHGFLHDASGWRLAPAFDINPSPRRGTIFSRAINSNDDPRARDIRNLAKIAGAYDLSELEAATILQRVGAEVEKWREIARSLNISDAQTARMRGAFDEEQLDFARSSMPAKATGRPPSGSVWIKPHSRNGKPVDGYWRGARSQ